jgi:hypothetical protein
MQTAHNRDGLPEIAVGLTFLLISGLTYLRVALPRGSAGFKAAVIASALLVPALGFGSSWALNWVRRHYLLERVGYVQYKPIGRRQIGFGILIAVLAALTLFGVVTRLPDPDRWLLAGTGLFGATLMACCGRQTRFVIGGVVMAAVGVCVAFAGVSLDIGFTLLFGFQGLVTLISGSVVFLRWIRLPIEAGE